jgi:cyclophilin family peptidyl-prolyl cis-trans isomerase
MKVFKLIIMLVLVVSGQCSLLNAGTGHRNNRDLIKANEKRNKGIYAELNTSKGMIVLNLNYEKAPMTVANFIGLAEGTIKNASYPKGKPFYDGSIWHRVVKGHVIQGGSPATDKAPEKEETSATGYEIPNERNDLSHNKAGMLGMANSGPHTNTCQFYITLADRSYLDGNYTLFGEVTEGMDVVNSIVQGDTIRTVKIIRIGSEAKKFKVDDVTFARLVDTQWKKVKNEEAERKVKDEAFIKSNYPGLTSAAGGLRFKILTEGKGERSVADSLVSASYSGRLINGTTFVSSAENGRPAVNISAENFTVNIGKDQIIKGLKSALTEMKQGEKRLLVIPPELAYGQNGFYSRSVPGQKRFVISPGEILILEVTLISFK